MKTNLSTMFTMDILPERESNRGRRIKPKLAWKDHMAKQARKRKLKVTWK